MFLLGFSLAPLNPFNPSSRLKGFFNFLIWPSDSKTCCLRAPAEGFPRCTALHFLFFPTEGIIILGSDVSLEPHPIPQELQQGEGCESTTSTFQPSPGLPIWRNCQQPRVREASQSPNKALSTSQVTRELLSPRHHDPLDLLGTGLLFHKEYCKAQPNLCFGQSTTRCWWKSL